MSRQMAARDRIDARRGQWRNELPKLDTSGMAVLGRMRWITQSARPQIEAVFSAHGLDSGEFDVIATLRRSGAPYQLTPTALYRSLMMSSGGMTARLKKLEQSGLVVRVADKTDARSLAVRLTKTGCQLAEQVVAEDMAQERALLAALSKSEQSQLADLLRKLVISLDAEDTENVG